MLYLLTYMKTKNPTTKNMTTPEPPGKIIPHHLGGYSLYIGTLKIGTYPTFQDAKDRYDHYNTREY